MDSLNIELILHRLDEISKVQSEISKKQDEFNKRVEDLTLQITKFKTIENTVDNIKEWKEKMQETVSTSELTEIKQWKSKMEELMSPSQLATHIKEHESFKTFKTQALMIWVVVQVIMTIVLFWDKIFK